jgi:hypothetical protein
MTQMHALPDSRDTSARPSVHLVSGDLFGALEAQLSPHAKHAYETYLIAFWREGNDMTVGDMRRAIRALYGDAVDRELEQHFEDRRQAVCPRSPNKQMSNSDPEKTP